MERLGGGPSKSQVYLLGLIPAKVLRLNLAACSGLHSEVRVDGGGEKVC